MLLLFLAALGALVVVNLFDEDLDPGAVAALDWPRERVPDAQNLFLAMLAFQASGDEAEHVRGRLLLDAQQAALAKPRVEVEPRPGLARLAGREPVELRVDPEQGCSLGRDGAPHDCFERSRRHHAVLAALIANNSVQLERYRALWSYPVFQDPAGWTLESEAPSYQSLIAAKRLLLSDWVYRIEAGDLDTVLRELTSDTRAWRSVLRAADAGLVEQMLANAAVSGNFLFASALLRAQALDETGLDALGTAMPPLAAEEMPLDGAYDFEFRAFARMMEKMANTSVAEALSDSSGAKEPPNAILAAMPLGRFAPFKKNDTINENWAHFEKEKAAQRAGCVALYAAALKPLEEAGGLPWWRYLYNPIGRRLIEIGPAKPSVYAGRRCDLLALSRAFAAQLAIQRQRLAPADIPAWLQAAAKDPSSDAPMRYESGSHALAFTVQSRSAQEWSPLPLR